MKYGSEEHKDAQLKALDDITELFMSVSLQEPLPSDENGQIIRDPEQDKLENLALKEQYLKLVDITDTCEGLQPWFVIRLFSMLQHKAQSELAYRNVLALTVNPTSLEKYGVPEHLIEGVRELHNYLRQDNPRERGKKGGSQQSKTQKENEATHIEHYKMFLADKGIYKYKMANYFAAMSAKTHATEKTVRRHLKKHGLK